MPLTRVAPRKPRPIIRVVRPQRRSRWLAAGIIAACLAPLAWESYRVVLGDNLHEVVPGKVYRCAQLPEDELRRVVAKLGIRTAINLRGPCPTASWYGPECAVLAELGVAQHDIPFSSEGLPPVHRLRQLLEVIETCERPLLLHCRRGADRTGLMSALCRLLLTDDDVPAARQQLSLRYGHVPVGETRILHQVLDMYEGWLQKKGQPHRPALLRQWVMEDYKPGHHRAEVQPLEMPERLTLGRPAPARFRVRNRSDYPWQFTKEPNRGVHLMCLIRKADMSEAWFDGAGFFDAVVPPGGAIELTLALPAIRTPGKYLLTVDMADPDGGWFFLYGSPSFEAEIEVQPDAGTPRRGDAEKAKL